MALSGSQRTRIGGHGAGRAYSGFIAKAITLFRTVPRAIAIMARAAGVFQGNRDASVAVTNRTNSVEISATERDVVIKRGVDK